jgi:predicted double-glycine peptidase
MVFQILLVQTAYSADVTIINGNIEIRKSVKSWMEFKNENVIRQQFDYSCGAASLATTLRYFFNEKVTEKDILDFLFKERGLEKKKEFKKEDFALSFQDLKEYAEKKGYRAVGLALPIESLKELRVPAIVYVKLRNDEHFTVYKGMDDRFVFLADPSFGNIKFRIEKFIEMFYTRKDLKYPGKVLVLIPQSAEKRKNVNSNFMKIPKESNLVYEDIERKAIFSGISPSIP